MFKITSTQNLEQLYEKIRYNSETYFYNLNSKSGIFENENTKSINIKLNFEEPQDNLVYSEIDQTFQEPRDKTIIID